MFANRAVQIAVAEETAEYSQSRCIGVADCDRGVGAGAKVDLGVGNPEFTPCFTHCSGAENRLPGAAAGHITPVLQGLAAHRRDGVFVGNGEQLARHCNNGRVDALQAVAQGFECRGLLQAIVQRFQLPNALESAQPVVDLRQATHASAGSGHRKSVTAAGDRLFAPRPGLADQFFETGFFIETHLLQGVTHQRDLGTAIACQSPR